MAVALFTSDELALLLQLDDATAVTYAGRLTLLTDMASALVLEAAGVETTSSATLKAVALNAAARAWSNPDGRTTTDIGDYSEGYAGIGGLYLTDSERQQCGQTTGLASPVGSFPAVQAWPDPPRIC